MTHDIGCDAQARLDELVEWIDHTLKLPMYQEPTTDAGRDMVIQLGSWRRLLVNGLHPDARAALVAARASESHDSERQGAES